MKAADITGEMGLNNKFGSIRAVLMKCGAILSNLSNIGEGRDTIDIEGSHSNIYLEKM
ncbi:MAG: hypothetical protein J7M24_02360 [Candidatus Latescibacteria bacterium]|nr:hypothetical protein [Candidatus Latescibacterota bacterium]